MMLSRSVAGKKLQNLIRVPCNSKLWDSRGYAQASTGATSFTYKTNNDAAVKLACRDLPGRTTRLAVFAKAGTRYQPAPGLALGLTAFAFKNTKKRSALRITRESELLGGQLDSRTERETLMLEAKFLREDLPFFAELLAEVVSETKFTTHEYAEQVAPLLELSQTKFAGDATKVALDSAHSVAFHRGLGNSIHPNPSSPISKYLNSESISEFSKSAYLRSNIAIVASGADQNELEEWVGKFFNNTPNGVSSLPGKATIYHGGEERILHPSGNSMVIAFPGSSLFAGPCYKPEFSVLSALIGGQPTIKWTNGFSLLAKAASNLGSISVNTSHHAYSDSGLLTIQLTGTAEAVRLASHEAYKALKSVAKGEFTKEDLTKAVSLARIRALEEQNIEASMMSTGVDLLHCHKPYSVEEIGRAVSRVSADNLIAVAQDLLAKKATVSAVGDLHVLPYAEEIGLKI